MPVRVHSTHRIFVHAPVDKAFHFFTPAGEEIWIHDWRPRYIDPPDGVTRAGMVFTTGEGDERTIWVLADFDVERLRSRYVRCTPASRVGFVEIRCTAIDDGNTEVEVTYSLTALGPTGERHLEAFEGHRFAAMIEGWATLIHEAMPRLMSSENCL